MMARGIITGRPSQTFRIFAATAWLGESEA